MYCVALASACVDYHIICTSFFKSTFFNSCLVKFLFSLVSSFTSTTSKMTETEPKVEAQQATKDDLLAAGDNADTKAPADGGDAGAQNASSPSKTGTLKSAGISVHKKDYENNVVYLYQFVRSATVPSLSACCLKVENWLRINGIQYEVCLLLNCFHLMLYVNTSSEHRPQASFQVKEGTTSFCGTERKRNRRLRCHHPRAGKDF